MCLVIASVHISSRQDIWMVLYLYSGALVAEGRVEEGADSVHEDVGDVGEPGALRAARTRLLRREHLVCRRA